MPTTEERIAILEATLEDQAKEIKKLRAQQALWSQNGLSALDSGNHFEAGGGAVRLYDGGIVLKNTTAPAPAYSLQGPVLFWVSEFPVAGQSGHSNADDHALIAGSAANNVTQLALRAFQNSLDNEANIIMDANASRSQIVFTWETPDAGQLSVYMTSPGAGRDWLDFTWDSGVVLRLAGRTTDISTSPVDGQIIWRSNTTKFRGYNGTAWDSFAMEAWVTAAITAGGSEQAKLLYYQHYPQDSL